jgi:hypothetical protein
LTSEYVRNVGNDELRVIPSSECQNLKGKSAERAIWKEDGMRYVEGRWHDICGRKMA